MREEKIAYNSRALLDWRVKRCVGITIRSAGVYVSTTSVIVRISVVPVKLETVLPEDCSLIQQDNAS